MAEGLVLAIDLGASRLRMALVDRAGNMGRRVEGQTMVRGSRSQALRWLEEAVAAILGSSPVLGICVAAASPVELATGTMLNPPNMPAWKRFPIGGHLSRRFHLPVLVDNDANLAALGEHYYGIGMGVSDLVYLTISTGIGGGILCGGQLVRGPYGLGAEVGHLVVERNGPPCGCGGRGCLEALASGMAIARMARERLSRGKATTLLKVVGGHPENITSQAVAQAAVKGDELSLEVLREAANALGAGISSLIDIFTPRLVILGGGVTRSLYLLLPELYRTVERQAGAYLGCPVAIVPAALGDNAGLLGAAAFFFQEARQGKR